MANSRISAKDKITNNNIKKDDLFKNTENEVIDSSKQENNDNRKHTNNETEVKRQTYYLEPDMIKALGFMAVSESRDKSEIIRTALQQYINPKYFEMVLKS